MPDIFIDVTEWYPVYQENRYPAYGKRVQVTPAQLKRIRAARKEFDAVQKLLDKLYCARGKQK